jgi:hypothetical protein
MQDVVIDGVRYVQQPLGYPNERKGRSEEWAPKLLLEV